MLLSVARGWRLLSDEPEGNWPSLAAPSSAPRQAARVWLHTMAYEANPALFLAHVEQFLAVAAK